MIRESDGKHDFPFYLLYFLWIMLFIRPDRLLGLPFLYPLTTIVQLALLFIWILSSKKVLHNKQTKYFLLFLLLLVISSVFARQTGKARITCQAIFFLFVTYLTTITFANNFSKFKKLLNIFLLGNIVMALLGLKIGIVLAIPTLGDENDYALLLTIAFPFAFFLAQEAQSKGMKIFYWASVILFILGNVISFSRGGFVGFIAVFAYCFSKTNKKLNVFLIVLALILAGAFLVPDTYLNEMATIKQELKGEGTESTGRLYYARLAWRMFIDHPVIGIGPRNFAPYFPEYIRPGDPEEKVRNPNYYYGRVSHSIYTTLLSELGILGVALFIALLNNFRKNTNFVKNLERKKRHIVLNASLTNNQKKVLNSQIRKVYILSLATNGGLIGLLVSGAFLSVLYYQWLWILLTMNVALANALQKALAANSVQPEK